MSFRSRKDAKGQRRKEESLRQIYGAQLALCSILLCVFAPFASLRNSELHKLKLSSEAPVRTVVKRSKLRAVEVVLHVARVPVVGNIENGNTHPALVLLSAERDLDSFRHQQIERHQPGEASAVVARSDEVLILIEQREWETTTPLNDRRGNDIVAQTKVAPEE